MAIVASCERLERTCEPNRAGDIEERPRSFRDRMEHVHWNAVDSRIQERETIKVFGKILKITNFLDYVKSKHIRICDYGVCVQLCIEHESINYHASIIPKSLAY